ncbi:radical SAM protein [Rhodoblastus acidophilus]|uniref:Radical SAM protein n=1 Tax=Candidatus Rhodoblastus alkanivorans TaxID=2954117 RepID=A0ABS9Z4P1_9HYPH|nr:radical SAM protein [Candidatus Rhodoblastus alkanivorans]MCI4677301.1 radical SAM protein [Candidatus Rhodoblastus alkanivorans]MCI4682036.1 radical SAM protein [Candidatus Rhodoblastus alkanivorans]MDI4643087.1 radical SAM protein [Rhodoblastus acidophilus]
MGAPLFRSSDYVEFAVHFRCNFHCVHCMIEGTMDWLRPQSDEALDALFAANARERKWKGLTLTGAEITLRPDLPALARRARDSGFDHVRIQTHGARLADPDYCRALVEAGVDEYFVSVAAADAATHDAITGVAGSFAQTMRGLENLDAFPGVVSLTNTVITRRSYRALPEVVSALAPLRRLVQMEFWAYWPMRETDEQNLIVDHAETLPYLREAILRARALGRRAEVKNFPQCLLGDLGDALDNGQPKLVIDPEFWVQFMRNGFHQCAHRDECGARRCLGLNTAYVNRFGWQADLLAPLPRED